MAQPLQTLQHIPAGWRLLICLAIGAVVFLWPFAPDDLMVHAGAAWLIGVVLFLGWTGYAVSGIPITQLRKRARQLDDSAWVISLLVVVAAVISLLALAMMLYGKEEAQGLLLALRLGLGGASLIASWLLIHTVLALHYAHLYYGDESGDGKQADRKGLDFPGKGDPDYWDFFYYSFVIGMTCQVSDISIQSRGMRRLTLIHSIVSFFFNTTVIALTVNLIASN